MRELEQKSLFNQLNKSATIDNYSKCRVHNYLQGCLSYNHYESVDCNTSEWTQRYTYQRIRFTYGNYTMRYTQSLFPRFKSPLKDVQTKIERQRERDLFPCLNLSLFSRWQHIKKSIRLPHSTTDVLR